MFKKTAMLTALLAVAAVALWSCARPAPHSPPLKVYSALDEDEAFAYLAEFKRQNPGVAVDLGFIDEWDLENVLSLPEAARPDVAWGFAAVNLAGAAKRNLLAPHAPAWLSKLDPRFYDRAAPTPRWVGMRSYLNCFASSEAERVETPFQIPYSHDDLLQPALANAIILPDPAKTGTGFMFVSAALQRLGEAKGWDFLAALDKNVKFYTDEPSLPVKQAGRGGCAVGVSYLRRGEVELGKGAPVVLSVPAGVGWELDACALARKTTPNPAAAKFLDWAASRPMMKIYARHSPQVAFAGMAGAPVAQYTKDGKTDVAGLLAKNDIAWAAENRDRVVAEWLRRFGRKRHHDSASSHPLPPTNNGQR